MGILRKPTVQRLILDIIPALALQVPRDIIWVDLGAEYSNVGCQGKEPPLSHEVDVKLDRYEGEQHSNGVTCRQYVDKEEVVRVRPGGDRCD